MSGGYSLVGSLELPTYTSNQSRVHCKLKLGVKVSDDDLDIIVDDVKSTFKKNSDIKDIKHYLSIKYKALDYNLIKEKVESWNSQI